MKTLTEEPTELTMNFTMWWNRVHRPRHCKESASDGWDAATDECITLASSLMKNPEFHTDHSRGHNEALEELVDLLKKLVR